MNSKNIFKKRIYEYETITFKINSMNKGYQEKDHKPHFNKLCLGTGVTKQLTLQGLSPIFEYGLLQHVLW